MVSIWLLGWFSLGLVAWLRTLFLEDDFMVLGSSAGLYVLATSLVLGPFLFLTLRR